MSEGCRSWETTASRARATTAAAQRSSSGDVNCPTKRRKLLAGAVSSCLVLFRPPARLQRGRHRARPPFPREQAKGRRLVERRCVVVRTAARSLFVVSCVFIDGMSSSDDFSQNKSSMLAWAARNYESSLFCHEFLLAHKFAMTLPGSFSRRLPLTLCTLALYPPTRPRATRSWIPA